MHPEVEKIIYKYRESKKQIEIPQQQNQFEQKNIIYSIYTTQLVQVSKVYWNRQPKVLKRIIRANIPIYAEQNKIISQLQACLRFKIDPDPYVVKYQKIWKTKQSYYILMQWCDGGNLNKQLQQDTISSRRAQLCVLHFLSILYGLSACYQRKIIHRDIKPQNILVTHNLRTKMIKIADFGVCTLQKRCKSLQGTNFYLAPQVFIIQNTNCSQQFKRQCENGYLRTCDLYSLGIICYHLHQGLDQQNKLIIFPFVQNLQQKRRWKAEDLYNLMIQYYTAAMDKYRITKNWVTWKNLTFENHKRILKFREIIQKLLEPHPKDRIQFHKLYQFIHQNRNTLFDGLENEQIIKDFDKYWNIQRQLNSTISNISLQQTELPN